MTHLYISTVSNEKLTKSADETDSRDSTEYHTANTELYV
jgi:hypothetical protein